MRFTPLADPFMVRFEKDGSTYQAKVTYVKSESSCQNFFEVLMIKPEGFGSFLLKEKPVRGDESDQILWLDENDKMKLIYQLIGSEIECHLKKDLGVFLIDAPIHPGNEALDAE